MMLISDKVEFKGKIKCGKCKLILFLPPLFSGINVGHIEPGGDTEVDPSIVVGNFLELCFNIQKEGTIIFMVNREQLELCSRES